MIDVLFFARIREQLGVDKLSVPPSPELTLSALSEQLVADHGEAWRQVLLAENVITAVNQEVVTADYRLRDGDEVAFFPPVTGG